MSVEELLAAYATGELEGEERERVESALEESPRLRENLEQYEAMFVLLAAAAEEEVKAPKGFRGRVERRVAIAAYLGAATNVLADLAGAYGRAILYYLRLV
ncbi:MAG: zf-HC2 domain-containing protein [Actinomycetota bacterium]|nr:zf-HC2 domain-containing protein [Actinomycetota bacterium]